ncbi:MAG: N-acetylmuramoyl-L-alanine amidase [Tissierellales bacterium]|nr:N-acetylmuramoyl-L-alanine amidase [Tissierellales bacterium]MBN2828395.1 N-acetylmuramoyl-L-alanine amidase [Tissierellales bacterium]
MNIHFVGNKHTNFSEREGYIPKIIVNHISEGSRDSCISWFTSPENKVSSAHFLVDQAGEIYQFVKLEKMAWANGLYIKENPNLFSISIEHEGIYRLTKGKLTDRQLASSIALHRYIIAEIKEKYGYQIIVNRKNILGHCDIDPVRKPFCPGEDFPYEDIINGLLTEEDTSFLDIKKHWAKEEIIYLQKKGVVEGRKERYFRPDEYITRAEAAKLLYAYDQSNKDS